MCDGRKCAWAGWPVGVVEVGVHGRSLHGSWQCTVGMIDGLALHRKLLRPVSVL